MKTKRGIALSIGLMLITFALGACSKGGGNATPTASFQTFYNSIKNKDANGVKSIMMKKELEEIEAEAKKKNKSLDDFIKEEMIEQVGRKIPAAMPETRNEKIEGDRATLEIKDGENWRTVRFAKEDGGWKINL